MPTSYSRTVHQCLHTRIQEAMSFKSKYAKIAVSIIGGRRAAEIALGARTAWGTAITALPTTNYFTAPRSKI